MQSFDSVSAWLADLRSGDRSAAAQSIWDRYMTQLLKLAKIKLGGMGGPVADEEDVAAAVFASFCRGAEKDAFSSLDDRTDLWAVLVMLTERKAIDQARKLHAKKRGGGQVRGESVFQTADSPSVDARGMDQIADGLPTPAFAAEVAEACAKLLQPLNDQQQRVALLKLEGHTNVEIKDQLGVSLSKVEFTLRIIRKVWSASDDRI